MEYPVEFSISIDELQLQQLFFQQIRKKAKSEKALVKELMEILGLGKSAIYRRLSGESMLSMGETFKLADHYDCSLDQFIGKDKTRISFDFPVLRNRITDVKTFMASIESDMARVTQLAQVSVDFISREIPLFHYFNFPELTAFKAYIWSRTIWRLPDYQERQFSLKQIKGIKRYQEKILKHYNKVPGSEIWSTDCLSITLTQIEYYLAQDMFREPEEALLLCTQLKSLFHHLYEMTTHGKKFSLGSSPKKDAPDFTLYHNQLAHSNSFILVNSPDVNMSFVTIDNLHTIKSSEPEFYQFMKDWKMGLVEKSIPVNSTATARNKFFNNIDRQLNRFEKRIKKYLEVV